MDTNYLQKIIFNKYLILFFRMIIGFIFIYAAIWKIAEPEAFAKNIENYRIIPTYLVNIFAIILPWLEIISGLFIILGLFLHAVSFIISALMGSFTLLVLSAIIRNIDTGCGCFSASDSANPLGWQKFFENIGLLLTSIIIYLSPGFDFTLEKYIKNKN